MCAAQSSQESSLGAATPATPARAGGEATGSQPDSLGSLLQHELEEVLEEEEERGEEEQEQEEESVGEGNLEEEEA